ncbi:terminase large subunit domain-containing protein [Pararhodobacter sp.]|uniref:terminase large subunit domain-containing protein n=1 Tax=Pararhodobacter sp. TaxID=2127056 RepID=UPI002AFE9E0B|nr:terminase family protein [Pararhodobacter sp.]
MTTATGMPVTEADWVRQRREATEAMPKVLAAVGLPKVLLPYQARAVSMLDSVRDCSALFIEKSRRIGLTWGLAAYAVLRAGRQRTAGGMDVMYISYSREMTREFIDACAMWARAFSIAAGAAEECLFDQGDEEGDKSIQAFRIRFASGFEVLALSSAPRGLRGKQGVVIVDEAAFVDNLAELIKAAMAFLMWGGQVVICSTHDGVDNPFNETIQDILAGRVPYRHMRIDFDQALQEGLYQRISLVKGEEWTPEGEAEWRQKIVSFYGDGADEELFCVPSASSGAWLPGPLIEARMTADAPLLRLELPSDYMQRPEADQKALLDPFMEELAEAIAGLDMAPQFAFGFDFGRVADLSVVSLLAIEARLKRREALALEMRNVPGKEQKRIVGDILEHVQQSLVGAAFDATGMGWTVAEDMGRKFGLREEDDGAGLVWAIKFSEEWYRLQMPPLKTAFEDDLIALIPDAEHLSDLRMMRLIRGIPRVPPHREGGKGKRRHGDYAIALALAHFASRMRWAEFGYRPVQASHESAHGEMTMTAEEDTVRGWWKPPLGTGLRGGIV